jgi:hypothetical protein
MYATLVQVPRCFNLDRSLAVCARAGCVGVLYAGREGHVDWISHDMGPWRLCGRGAIATGHTGCCCMCPGAAAQYKIALANGRDDVGLILWLWSNQITKLGGESHRLLSNF